MDQAEEEGVRGADVRGRAGAPDDAALSGPSSLLFSPKEGSYFCAFFLYLLEMEHYQNLAAQYMVIFIVIFFFLKKSPVGIH